MTLGEIILQYREDHHMSQRQFALKCGISNGYIAMIEKNENPATGKPVIVSVEKVRAIASAMNMTSDELVRMVDGNTPVSLEAEQTGEPRTVEARIVSFGMDQLPQEERERLLAMVRAWYSNRPGLFDEKKGDDRDP